MTFDPVAVCGLLVALWALWRTRPRPTITVNWKSPTAAYVAREAGQ